MHRWFYAIAGFGGLALSAACLEPALSPYASLVANVGSLSSLLVVWRGGSRDQGQAEAAMQARSGSASYQ